MSYYRYCTIFLLSALRKQITVIVFTTVQITSEAHAFFIILENYLFLPFGYLQIHVSTILLRVTRLHINNTITTFNYFK